VLNVLHEDPDLLVVNKPAGLVCHPTKNGEMSSLIGRARLYLDSRPGTQDLKPYMVNRLDRETSGIVLIAKNPATAGEIGKVLESRAVQKEYLAIVHGHVPDDHGVIDAPLGKDDHSIVAVKDRVRPDGAPAQTEYFLERRFSVGVQALACPDSMPKHELQQPGAGKTRLPFSLLRVVPGTGRKHQLRIHLAHIGHPIVGDKLYGHDEDCYLALAQDRLTPEHRAKLILPNHALDARALQFDWRGRPWKFSCEPEPWFTQFLV